MVFPVDTDQILTAAAVFLRIMGIISLLPLFGEGSVPVRVRIMLSAALSVGIYPILPPGFARGMHAAMGSLGLLGMLIMKEVLIGMVLGYTAKLAFDGIVMAANVVGIQIGFNTSNIFLPDSGHETTKGFSALHRLLIILVFFSLNMHHIYLASIMDSFKLIPLGFAWPTASLNNVIVSVSAGIFVTALQLAAPTLVGLLFSTAALGLISRAVPQANVFVMSFPANFFTGLFIYMAMLPMLPGWLQGHFATSQHNLMAALAALVR